ncbi:unnamed protein product [Calicophoron daubneyi]
MTKETEGHASKRVADGSPGPCGSKKARISEDVEEESLCSEGGWQATLGTSLAEQLEQLTVKQHLTARQVKKLLRAVLTNEDVVSAFRRYINLSDPETGELSASTRRKAKGLGLLSTAPNESGKSIPEVESRVLTRSLTRSLHQSLREYLPAKSAEATAIHKPRTILDMEFPDEDDEGEGDEVATDSCTLKSPSSLGDTEYRPGPLDFQLLRKDRFLDLYGTEGTSITHTNTEDGGDKNSDENSNQSGSVDMDYSGLQTPSPEISTDLDDLSTNESHSEPSRSPYLTRSRAAHNPLISNSVNPSSPTLMADELENRDTGEHRPSSTPGSVDDNLSASAVEPPHHRVSTPILSAEMSSCDDPEDAEDTVYAEFLRSLFPPSVKLNDTSYSESTRTPTTESGCNTGLSPGSQGHQPVVASTTGDQRKGSASSVDRDEDEDPDDPEFDVMAELDQVDREDFFDELRDDRAVRVSKLEAKTLHEDLRNMFNEEEEDEYSVTESDRPRTSTVFAMKSQCHRLFSGHRLGKLEDVSDEQRQQSTTEAAASRHDNVGAPNFSEGTFATETAEGKKFTPEQLNRLQRQLGMHIQLLTTSFLCTYDFPRLRQAVTQPCARALKELASRREAFDLMAEQHVGYRLPARLTSFYWVCPSLDEAVQLVSDYAGLSCLPRLPKPRMDSYTNKKQWRSIPRSAFNMPLPRCLVRLMTNNPVWSYAYLMPAALPSTFDLTRDEAAHRVIYHPSEDALILMGLADFGFGESAKKRRPYITYHLIRKHLLPCRTLLQLRARRWNLLGSKAVGTTTSTSPNCVVPLPTRRLHQLYSSLSDRHPISQELLQQFADEVATVAFPYNSVPSTGCLSEQSAKQWIARYGLPRQPVYGRALYFNQNSEETRQKKVEWCKLIQSVLSGFVQRAECLWWSNSQTTDMSHRSYSYAAARPVDLNANVLKQEQEEALSPSDPTKQNIFSPTFLPAIPVDLTPDGSIVLTKGAQPVLVEVRETACQITPKSDANPMPVSDTKQHVKVVGRVSGTPTIAEYIEAALVRTHQQASGARNRPRPLDLKTLEELASPNVACGKVPLPPLFPGQSKIIRKSRAASESGCQVNKESPLRTTPFSEVMAETLARERICADLKKTNEPAIVTCQKLVNALNTSFHKGVDRILNVQAEESFSPRRFAPIPKASPFVQTNQTERGQCSLDLSPPLKDSLSIQSMALFPNSCLLTAGRFLNRCKARGEATSADLILAPSSLIAQRQSALDEFDIRRARSLLDRCRAYLPCSKYGTLVSTLKNLNQIVHGPGTSSVEITKAQKHREIRELLTTVLHLLEDRRPLWEDFLCLLTPQQARSVGLLPSFINLARVHRAQRVMHDLVPGDRRFWRRLRTLADSLNPHSQFVSVKQPIEKQLDLSGEDSSLHSVAMTEYMDNSELTNPNRNCRNNVRRGGAGDRNARRLRSRVVRSPLSKTWSFLEGSWRNRPILLLQLANLTNVNHKPYAGFEQSFEEVDLLARHPLGNAPFQKAKDPRIKPEPSSPSVSSNEDDYSLSQGWEVCTQLSAANRRHRSSSNATSRHCPCPCHPGPSSSGVGTLSSGKPAKADSLGLRHCICCSLRVHRGIVYVDECNFHLRPVQITWPVNFKPKARLPSASIRKDRSVSSANNSFDSSVPPVHLISSVSTRVMLTQLAEEHEQPNRASVSGSVIDAARRRLCIEFLPSVSQPTDKTETSTSTPVAITDKEILIAEPDGDGDQPCSPQHVDRNPSEIEKEANLPSLSPSWMIDDDAACFNTEAFASTSPSNEDMSKTLCPGDEIAGYSIPLFGSVISWDPEEDRQLLEFCKARGWYNSSMFEDLAKIWVPKPNPYSRSRTAVELESRFKDLMRLTLGDAYDPQLFQSPEREISDGH